MSKRLIGLTLGISGVLWLVFSTEAARQWELETKPLREAVRAQDAAAVKSWIEAHRGTEATGRYKDALVEAASWATSFDPDDVGAPLVYSRERVVAILNVIVGSRPHANDAVCQRVFTHAAECGYTSVVKGLINRGIDVNCRDAGGWTALVRAADQANTAMVQLLLERGANPNTEFDYPGGPLGGHHTLLSYLRTRVALRPDETRPDWATTGRERYAPVIQLLKQYGARE